MLEQTLVIGRKFFNILDESFPKHHNLYKVIRHQHGKTKLLLYAQLNVTKLNVGRLLKAHNQKVLKQHQEDCNDLDSATCNCRNKKTASEKMRKEG